MTRIASRVSQLNGEGALAVYSRAKELERQGRSIIHLELGEPDFHPAAPVVDAVRNAVAAGRDRYCSTRGVPALREAIAEYLNRTRRLEVAAEQVLIAPGCKMALSLAMMALIEPGDEVLYPDPGFPIYPSFTRGLGATAVPFGLEEKNKFHPDIEEIARKITPRTSMIIFNSPNNPTGTVFSNSALEDLVKLAVKHDLWILSDEIYARILFTGEYKSIWSLPGMAERTVIIDGFSKSFAMTGWRLGCGGANARDRRDGSAGAEHVYLYGGVYPGGGSRSAARFHERRGCHGCGIPQTPGSIHRRACAHSRISLSGPGRCILRVGEYRRYRALRRGIAEIAARRGRRRRNCRRGVWSGRQELP
jgi:aspartate/methionine/tyrosine aminotransferase